MFNKQYRRSIVILSTILVFLTGCNASTPLIDPKTDSSSESPTIIPFTLTPDVSPTPIQLPTGPGVEWDLVVIGDSSLWKLADAFAAQIEKDVGVKVIVHDITPGGLSAGKVLRSLQVGDTLTNLPDRIKDAEVVVMFVNPLESIDPENPLGLEACFYYTAPESCGMESFGKYIDDLKAIWEEIFILRAGQPTIVRATDIYNPLVANWQKTGVFEACNECWLNMSKAAQAAAEAYNIPFLSRFEALNGPDYLGNLKEKGYLSSDGEHPSDLMGQYTAELLAEIGYDPVIPP